MISTPARSLRSLARSRATLSFPLHVKLSNTMAPVQPKHLKTGDAQPPLQKGLLRVYNMRYCPYAQRALLVLDAKKIPYDIVNVNLTSKPDFIFQKSDGGKVPAIEFEDGTVLSESLIVSDYLDEAYPDPPLYPADKRAKAIEKLWITRISDVTSAFYRLIVHKDGLNPENFEGLVKKLEVFENELKRRGTTFFGGEKPNMVDLMLWPWAERAPLAHVLAGDDFQLPTRLSALLKWTSAMTKDETVKCTYLPPEVHLNFLSLRQQGIYDFDHHKL